MPFVYVYSPSDFVGGLPNEQGAAAAGSGPFNLTLSPDASPTIVEINDDDGVLDEVDYGQTIAGGIDLDGTSYSSGTTIHSAYDLINSSSGHQVTSIHFGGSGYEQGAVHGLVSSVPLEAGQTYSFDVERTSHRKSNDYDDFVACFVAGNRVQGLGGEVFVEDLEPGDQVATIDGSAQRVRLVLRRQVTQDEMSRNPNLRPVRITAGAMGQGLPKRDILVSPQHRMLVNGRVCQRVFGETEALVSARRLTVLPGVYVDRDAVDVCYVHLVFDTHQIIFVEDAPSESFYFGSQAITGLSDEAREELLQLFPALQMPDYESTPARLVPAGRAQLKFVKRLLKNDQAPLSTLKASMVAD